MVDEIMLFLLKSGAHRAPAILTTTDIGQALGMSQQNVSRRMLLLEHQGKVERRKGSALLTDKGVAEIRELLALIQNSFDSKLRISGTVADGLGEGGFYISKAAYARGIRNNFGFEPYPGTLNIKLDSEGIDLRRRMMQLEPQIVPGFRENGRMYGDLFSYQATLGGIKCAVVVPMRTHHGSDIIEVVAPVNLRKRLNMKTGNEVVLNIW